MFYEDWDHGRSPKKKDYDHDRSPINTQKHDIFCEECDHGCSLIKIQKYLIFCEYCDHGCNLQLNTVGAFKSFSLRAFSLERV